MEQKAKRVGKFNIIDIIAVILIVAVVAFGAWKRQMCIRDRSCTRPARPICPLR